MRDFSLSLISGSVLCTVHLLLGMVIGYFIGQCCQTQSTEDAQARRFQASLEALARQIHHLSKISAAHNTAISPALFETIASSADSVRALQLEAAPGGRAHDSGHSMAAGKPDPPVAVSPVASFSSLASVESDPVDRTEVPLAETQEGEVFTGLSSSVYEELTGREAVGCSNDDPLSVRRPYHVPQYMASWDSALPRACQYQEVECHDLSASGISFFVKELPVTRYVTITLGNEHDLLMLAEVVNHQRRQRGRSFVYLVGCRFTKRLSNVPEENLPVTFHQIQIG